MLRLAGTGSNLRKAFTLVEMLAVTAITAILVSILPAVFVRVGAKARQAQCASDLRHLGSALQMYADHNDQMHVPVIVWVSDIDWYWRASVLACARADWCGSLALAGG